MAGIFNINDLIYKMNSFIKGEKKDNSSTNNSYKDVLDRIRSQHPKLFEGCEANSLIVGTINGYIGFGEEPKYQRSSFNKEK